MYQLQFFPKQGNPFSFTYNTREGVQVAFTDIRSASNERVTISDDYGRIAHIIIDAFTYFLVIDMAKDDECGAIMQRYVAQREARQANASKLHEVILQN